MNKYHVHVDIWIGYIIYIFIGFSELFYNLTLQWILHFLRIVYCYDLKRFTLNRHNK